jgi:hypothetical protein
MRSSAMRRAAEKAVLASWFTATAAILCAQAPVQVHIGNASGGRVIPDDFAGLSFESSNLIADKDGTYQFSAANKKLIQLFRVIGIRNLRVGGGTADGPEYKVPGPTEIDQLFAFAKAADVKVIYTLRLLNGDVKTNADIARYIGQHYGSQLVCFQIGNEPDWHSFHTSPGHPRDPRIVESVPEQPGSAYPSFLASWRQFAAAITAQLPSAAFTGHDTGSDYPLPGTKNTDFDGHSWTEQFAKDEKTSGHLLFVTQHDYPGQSATGVSLPAALTAMLSKDWTRRLYPMLFDHVMRPVEVIGLSYRMTEANDYTGGVNGASNAFASALWTLDYLHWHAAHGATGVNFHNKRWIYTDTVYRDPGGDYHFNPKAYGIKAFDLTRHGFPVPLTIANIKDANVTAYAVHGTRALYVTLINKEFGNGARVVTVTIDGSGVSGAESTMALLAPNSDVTARDDITLGGASLGSAAWTGAWTRVGDVHNGHLTVQVPPASALLIKIDGNQSLRGGKDLLESTRTSK